MFALLQGTLTVEQFVTSLALIGVVIIVSALLSGLIDRSGLPQVAVFLALGAAFGPYGLSLMNISLESSSLHVVAILSLALVLFTDAVTLNITEVRRRSGLAIRLLGPGTLLTAALLAVTGWWLLGLSPAAAAILGAALASTDPVLLRGLLRRRDIPEAARQPLQLESGLNDVVLLPVVLVGIAFLSPAGKPTGSAFAKLGLDLFLLGPGAGILIGLLGVAALDLIRKRSGVRRDYESLYSLGICFTAFAAAESVHGSGFLAAFAAGMTIASLDVELCDCFVEYGAVTAEMFLLFTFVLLGGSLIWSAFTIVSVPTLIFTAIAVSIRTPIYLLSLLGSDVNLRGRLLIAWFGPRGLSSLLLVLLPIFAGVPGSEQLFSICSMVVLVSIVLHGGSPMLLASLARRRALKQVGVVEQQAGGESKDDRLSSSPQESSGQSCPIGDDNDGESAFGIEVTPKTSDEGAKIGKQSITIDDLKRLWEANEPVIVLDVRKERSLEGVNSKAAGAVRMPPDHVVERAKELGLPKEAWLIAYCA